MDTTNNKTTSNFLDLSDATAMSKGTNDGCLTIVPSGGSYRTRLAPELLDGIDNPDRVEVLELNGELVVLKARTESAGISLGKGRYLYDSELAKSIAKMANVTLGQTVGAGEPKSIHVGRYRIENVDANTKAAVVSF